jgi:hypothetical protein
MDEIRDTRRRNDMLILILSKDSPKRHISFVTVETSRRRESNDRYRRQHAASTIEHNTESRELSRKI